MVNSVPGTLPVFFDISGHHGRPVIPASIFGRESGAAPGGLNAVDLRDEAFSLKCEYRISNKEYRIMKLHCAHPNLPVLSIKADSK